MTPIRIRDLEIGNGIPKIIVPIVGEDEREILEQAKLAKERGADMVEWRIDFFAECNHSQSVRTILEALRQYMGNTPILVTFRTAKEGGEKDISVDDYVSLYQNILKTELADLIDVELFMGEKILKSLVQSAHDHHALVIASSHDFEKTPPKKEILSRLIRMQEWGADLAKIAVMPQTSDDVKTLLEASQEMVSEYARGPIVTMSMSDLGKITRVIGEVSGSSMTFGSAQKASAPGQIEVRKLKAMLEEVHRKVEESINPLS